MKFFITLFSKQCLLPAALPVPPVQGAGSCGGLAQPAQICPAGWSPAMNSSCPGSSTCPQLCLPELQCCRHPVMSCLPHVPQHRAGRKAVSGLRAWFQQSVGLGMSFSCKGIEASSSNWSIISKQQSDFSPFLYAINTIWNYRELDTFWSYKLKQLHAKNNRRGQHRLHFTSSAPTILFFLCLSRR